MRSIAQKRLTAVGRVAASVSQITFTSSDSAGIVVASRNDRFQVGDKVVVTDGPFAETKDLIAGWMVIDVDSYERAVELAGDLSAAPGAGGKPIHEWIELRPFLTPPPTITE